MKSRTWIVVLTILVSLYSGPPVYAQGGEGDFPTDNDVNEIAKKLYCPVCPNTPLDVCETQACQDWRAQIKSQLAEGWTEDQIIDYFVAQYGERVLAEPKRKGFSTLVWLLPTLGLALGFLVVRKVLQDWRFNRGWHEDISPSEVKIPPETLARIEEQLEEIR